MNTQVAVIEVKDLIPVEYIERETFFLNANNEIDPLINKVKDYYSSIYFDGMDGKTEQGRKQIKKLAAELNNVIKTIDGYGKAVVDILKDKPKKIDAGRKKIKDALGELYETIRKPVVEYEAEQARIKAEEEAKLAEEQRLKDEELDKLRAENERLEREEQIRKQAAETARTEAENKAKEAELALQREREANERKEQERLAEEKRIKDEEEKRLADTAHIKAVNNEALNAFISLGVDEDVAKQVITLIYEQKIPNIKINY